METEMEQKEMIPNGSVSSKKQIVSWISLALSLLTLLGLVIFLNSIYQKIDQRNNEVALIKDELDNQNNEITSLKTDVYMLVLSNYLQEGVVTEDLIVHKISFFQSPDRLTGIIDITTQPQMALHYEGSGKFDVSDRELRSMLLTLMEKFGSIYKEQIKGIEAKLPSWNTADFTITINNYELGTYRNGEVVLKGEK